LPDESVAGSIALERHQVWFYAAAVLAGLGLGTVAPRVAPSFEAALWPVVGILLYATFTQVPLTHLPDAFRDGRFMTAVLAGNFVLVPLVVWGLVGLLPVEESAIRLGVLLVLLVPCTAWFITFTHLAGGDTRRAIAVTPVNLLVQLALLPLYLRLFIGESFIEIFAVGRIAVVFVTLIGLPLLAAFATERWAERRPGRDMVIGRLGWLPVPMLALIVFLIAGAQARSVADIVPVAGYVTGLFVAYLVAAALIGVALGRLLGLAPQGSRALVFSLGTRNSFVILPLTLALSAQWQAATLVVVLQCLVELFGMIVYVWVVPRFLIPSSQVNPEAT
jgi:arsenite transporter